MKKTIATKKIILTSVLTATLALGLGGQRAWAMLELFTQKYALPQETSNLINKNKALKDHLKRPYTFGQIDGLNGFLLKDYGFLLKDSGGVNRLINSVRMRNCIQKYNLTRLDVPRKYVYKIDDQWLVFAEYVNTAERFGKLTLEETQQLAKFVEETGYSDFFGVNILRDNRNKLVFIDTEDNSFGTYRCCAEGQSGRPDNCKSRYLANFYSAYSRHLANFYSAYSGLMEPGAAEWLRDRVDTVTKQDEERCRKEPNFTDPTIPHSSVYDDPEIDFEKVKQQIKNQKIGWYSLLSKLFSFCGCAHVDREKEE